MNTKEQSKKPRSHHPERIILRPEALARVNLWTERITFKLKGSAFSRSDLVSWMITNRAEELSEAEETVLVNTYFDPLKAVRWATKIINEKHKAGDTVDVKTFIAEALALKQAPEVPRRPRIKKAKPLEKGASSYQKDTVEIKILK